MKTSNLNTMNNQDGIIAASISHFPTLDTPSLHRRYGFKAGVTWQQQKDKITIDKLISVLNTCLSCLTLDSDMEEDFEPEITEAKKLLKQIEKEKQ